VTHTITLVGDVYVSKAEALNALSTLLGVPINTTDPSNAVLDLDGGVVLSIEVPKFGEDLPLTLDVTGPGESAVSEASSSVIESVGQGLGWTLWIAGSN
jgi:hypothetical protein